MTRGSKKAALQIAGDDQLMATALDEYEKEWYSSGDTGPFYVAAWMDFHYAHWDGVRRPLTDPIPLTPAKTHVAGAIFKAA